MYKSKKEMARFFIAIIAILLTSCGIKENKQEALESNPDKLPAEEVVVEGTSVEVTVLNDRTH